MNWACCGVFVVLQHDYKFRIWQFLKTLFYIHTCILFLKELQVCEYLSWSYTISVSGVHELVRECSVQAFATVTTGRRGEMIRHSVWHSRSFLHTRCHSLSCFRFSFWMSILIRSVNKLYSKMKWQNRRHVPILRVMRTPRSYIRI